MKGLTPLTVSGITNTMLDSLYRLLPVPIQNFVLSAVGYRYNLRRYGGRYCANVDDLMRSQWLSKGEFEELQLIRLRDLLLHAADTVPHYQKALRPWKNSLGEIDFSSLRELPCLEKCVLRANVAALTDRSRMRHGVCEGHTSGTSGTPFVWPYDYDSMQLNLAFRERQYRWAGLTGRELSARFSGRLVTGSHQAPPFWRYNHAERQWLFSTYHLTEKNMPAYYEALQAIRPSFLDGYPSALFALACWINQQGLSGHFRVWAVFTTAETLQPHQRDGIAMAFGCQVLNFYSSSEGAPFVTTCPAGRQHLNPESGIIEFLRPDGQVALPGEEAAMVVTSFFQRTVPLIRYKIGDRGVMGPDEPCPCGRQMPLISAICGREQDVVRTSERGAVGSAGLSTALYCLPGRLLNAQLQQTGHDQFVFRYVPAGAALTQDECRTVEHQLRDRLGDIATIKISAVQDIPLGSNGKKRLIIGLGAPPGERLEKRTASLEQSSG